MHFLPVHEIGEAWLVTSEFVGVDRLRHLSVELLIVTALIQVPVGFLGIAFLRKSQDRSNRLLLVGESRLSAHGYVRIVARYVFFVSLPFLFQKTVMQNLNQYAFGVFRSEVESALRVESLFPEGGAVLLGAVGSSEHTTSTYADSLTKVVDGSCGIIERKLFSIPKLLLLPGMLWSRPLLIAAVLPVSIALDFGKSMLTGLVTEQIEEFSERMQELTDQQQRIEQHDTKYEDLIRRGAVGGLARERWRGLSSRLTALRLRRDALETVNWILEWLYWQDFMTPGFECAIGFLLECGHITNVDIFLSIRVVEDAIDALLTRSRLQAELASMQTHVKRLKDLSDRLSSARDAPRANCIIASSHEGVGEAGQPAESLALRLQDVSYTRGSDVRVQIGELTLSSGRAYAVTGPNGCGKSSFFGLLASCGRLRLALPLGMELETPGRVELPSDDVVEITQQLYCPLHISPLEWLLRAASGGGGGGELSGGGGDVDADVGGEKEARIRALLEELLFSSAASGGSVAAGGGAAPSSSPSPSLPLGLDGEPEGSDDRGGGAPGAAAEDDPLGLRRERDDWYGELSGGQRVKVELVAKVFARASCPALLLLDESFAPLDPRSRAAVQRKLKAFCSESIVLVIYHSDSSSDCVHSGGFYDGNLHFENGTARLVELC